MLAYSSEKKKNPTTNKITDLYVMGRYRQYIGVTSMLRRKIKLFKEENAILDGMSGNTSLIMWWVSGHHFKTKEASCADIWRKSRENRKSKGLEKRKETGQHGLSGRPRERTVGSEIRQKWRWVLGMGGCRSSRILWQLPVMWKELYQVPCIKWSNLHSNSMRLLSFWKIENRYTEVECNSRNCKRWY